MADATTDSTSNDALYFNSTPIQDARFRVPKPKLNPVIMDLGAAAAKYYSFKAYQNMTILMADFNVTEEAVVATGTAPSIALGIDGVLISGTQLTIPAGTAIGASVQTKVLSVDVDAGEVVSFHVNQIAVGGSIAGKGYAELTIVDRVKMD